MKYQIGNMVIIFFIGTIATVFAGAIPTGFTSQLVTFILGLSLMIISFLVLVKIALEYKKPHDNKGETL